MIGIYKITNPEGKIYIGLSKNIESRWNSYKNKSGMAKTSTFKLSLDKYKYEDHIFEVIEEVIDNNKLLRERERYWINYYQSNINNLNDNRGGCGTGSHTPESKQKIASALKGKPKPDDFGKKRSREFYTEEWKQKISQSSKGISRNKGRISPNKGKVMGDDQKQKISLSQIGKIKPNAGGNKPIQQYTLDGQFIAEYQSVSDAHRITEVPQTGISLCCNNKRISSGGFKWNFLN